MNKSDLKNILTDEEKAYLKAVIEPIKDNVEYIYKGGDSKSEYIFIGYIRLYPCDYKGLMFLYDFEKNTQFKNMKLDKQYTLKELGLE